MTKNNEQLSEAKIQSTCVQFMWNERPQTRGCFFSVTNNSEHAARGANRKALGLVPGVSDTLFIWETRIYCFEFKTEDGKQSPRQQWWQELIEKQGAIYVVIRSLEQFKKYIDEIL